MDDEAPIRMLIRKYAEYEGYTADEAADGMEAVRLARGGTPRPPLSITADAHRIVRVR